MISWRLQSFCILAADIWRAVFLRGSVCVRFCFAMQKTLSHKIMWFKTSGRNELWFLCPILSSDYDTWRVSNYARGLVHPSSTFHEAPSTFERFRADQKDHIKMINGRSWRWEMKEHVSMIIRDYPWVSMIIEAAEEWSERVRLLSSDSGLWSLCSLHTPGTEKSKIGIEMDSPFQPLNESCSCHCSPICWCWIALNMKLSWSSLPVRKLQLKMDE